MEQARLAELVASKVCHDFMGPMTALMRGLELLTESGAAQKDAEALSLLETGVAKAHAKLDFYRHALGGALGASDSDLKLSAARPAAELVFSTFKASLDWRADDISMPRAALRVVLNMLMIANDCLAKGGVIGLEAEAGEVRVIAAGERARLRQEISDGLRGEFSEDGYQALYIQPFLTALLARQAGVELSAREAPNRIELVLKSPLFRAQSAAGKA
jgi:histidine phosphotransferase ChpT